MNTGLSELNPLRKQRPRLGLLVSAAIALLAFVVSSQFSSQLTKAYRDAAASQLRAIATTWEDGFRGADIEDPATLQRRVERLKANNKMLHQVSLSWHDPRGRTVLVRQGHEHTPNGEARDVSTSSVTPYASESRPAPVDARSYGLRELYAPGGAHYLEFTYPLERDGRVVAVMELHYDLARLDEVLARDKRTLWLAAALAAATLTLLLHFIIGYSVFIPLKRLRRAARRLGSGEVKTRLRWQRSDELGELAADFDRMADELETAQEGLQALALKDPLTGLLNHRALQERMSQELRRAEREGYPVAVVALDVDHFKEVNDRFGHAAGDDALRALARAIRTELRPSDICGRVGGDEFMLALIRSDADEARSAVERLRTSVARTEIGPACQALTISAGISEFPRHSLSREDLMHLADGAMYWAKSSGRNRSVVYTSDSDLALSAQEAADRAAHDGLVNTVHALANAVDAKDGYTHSHSQRVARYAAALAEDLGMSPDRVEEIRTAGVLHDVGKIGISDVLLLKPGCLSEDEFATMRRHSELGRDIIAGAGMDRIADFVLHLHERYDGRGYPDGLAGDDIPVESRILHVADTLEAMTSDRVYRRAFPLETALEELERGAGTQFDPHVAVALVAMLRNGDLELGFADDVEPDESLVIPVDWTLDDAGRDRVRPTSNGHAPGTNGLPSGAPHEPGSDGART